jgi:hypothetical protein
VSDAAEADRGIDALRKAVAAGYHNVSAIRNDPRFDPIRARQDFRLLMMDLDFPLNPLGDNG